MIILKEKVIKAVSDVVCDICGISCKNMIDSESFNIESASLTASWGYGSRFDGERYKIDLCEGCFEKTLNFLKCERKTTSSIDPLGPLDIEVI